MDFDDLKIMLIILNFHPFIYIYVCVWIIKDEGTCIEVEEHYFKMYLLR